MVQLLKNVLIFNTKKGIVGARNYYSIYSPMSPQNATLTGKRLLYWSVVILYTGSLPQVIFAYRKISENFSSQYISKIPITLVLALTLSYLILAISNKRPLHSYLLLIPCLIIYLGLTRFEPYTNKHIHIPEYTILAWLVYLACSIDYEGKGILLLVFLFSSLVGCIDEIVQGIHPARFYGWKDMLINTLSVLIGILTIAGLKEFKTGTWNWIYDIKQNRSLLPVIIFGLTGTALTLYYLFQLKLHDTVQNTYPAWLFLWNSAFSVLGIWVLVKLLLTQKILSPLDNFSSSKPKSQVLKTSFLWSYCLIIPLLVIHMLALYVIFSGRQFQ